MSSTTRPGTTAATRAMLMINSQHAGLSFLLQADLVLDKTHRQGRGGLGVESQHPSRETEMRGRLLVPAVCLLALTVLSPVTAADQQHTASGSKGLVVPGRAAATRAGIRMLEQGGNAADAGAATLLALRSEEHTSELQSLRHLVCRLLL